VQEGLDLLEQALALDPDYTYAKAMVCYAHTCAAAARCWTFEQGSAAYGLTREVLDEQSDDPLALAYAGHCLAYVGQFQRDGLTALNRAAILNSNLATVAMLLGWVHIYFDEADAAILHLTRARRISLPHPQIGAMSAGMGQAMMHKGDCAGAVALLEQSLAEYPGFASAYFALMGCYWQLGRDADAAGIAGLLREKVPDLSVDTFVRTRQQNSANYTESVIGALRATGFPA